jgi:hypothetical protein
MLEIDYGRVPDKWIAANNSTLKADKLRPDPSVPGRFIYTVSKKRADERIFGFAEAHNKDQAEYLYDNYGGVASAADWLLYQKENGGNLIKDDKKMNQDGERKRLPFKKTSITSKGDISITSNKDKVVFWDKTFKVKTEHLKGKLFYQKKGETTSQPVPDNSFVAFVRKKTNARIGVVTLNKATGEASWFELNLRDEYTFGWNDDPIDFYFTDKDGKVYNFNYKENGVEKSVDLDLLFALLENKTPITLTEQEESTEPEQ